MRVGVVGLDGFGSWLEHLIPTILYMLDFCGRYSSVRRRLSWDDFGLFLFFVHAICFAAGVILYELVFYLL